MDDDFTYFVKILDDNGDRYYLKSSIDERTNTIIMQLTNLKAGWSGTCNVIGRKILAFSLLIEFSESTTSSNISEEVPA